MDVKGGRSPHAADAIAVHVEELLLEGFHPGDRRRVGHAVERELGRLIRQRGIDASHDARVERVDGGTFAVNPGIGPDRLGVDVARAVHRAVGRPSGRSS